MNVFATIKKLHPGIEENFTKCYIITSINRNRKSIIIVTASWGEFFVGDGA